MAVDGAIKLSVACFVAHPGVNDIARARLNMHEHREDSSWARLSQQVSTDALISNVERQWLF